MTRMTIPFLLLVAALAGLGAVEPAADASDTIDLQPRMLTFTRTASYGADEGVQGQDRLELALTLTLGSEVRLRRFGSCAIDQLVTDSGEVLSLDATAQAAVAAGFGRALGLLDRRRQRARGQAGADEPLSVEVSLPLPAPTQAFGGLQTVSGSITADLATSGLRKVVMRPLDRWIEQVVQIGELPGCFVTTKRPADDRLRLFFSRDFALRFEALRVLDSTGVQVDMHLIQLNREPGKGLAAYSGAMPEGAYAEMAFYPDLETVTVPFTFERLALPGPAFHPTPDWVAEPADPEE